MKWKLILSIIFLITIGTSCSSKSNNWPDGMTPFFAVCEDSGKVYTDRAYGKRKQMPCFMGWKFYDRGEPTLTND